LDEKVEDGEKEHSMASVAKAFSELEASIAEPFLQMGSVRRVLGRIADLNAEVGKSASSSPQLLSRLKVFQLRINDVTLAVKKGEENEARIALAEARAVMEGLFL
jgi:hypothetical protein